MSQRMGRLRGGVLVLAVLAATSLGAFARTAWATAGDPNHSAGGVEHGFYPGGSSTDGSFFSRAYPGGGTTYEYCGLIVSGYGTVGSQEAYGTTTCSAWSNAFGSYTECHGSADVYALGVVSRHTHYPTNYCG